MEEKDLTLNIPELDTEKTEDSLASEENSAVVDEKVEAEETAEKTERPVRERRESPAREPRERVPRDRRVSSDSSVENETTEQSTESTETESTERPVRERRERPAREPRERVPRERRGSSESSETTESTEETSENTERPVRERRERPAREPRERTPRERAPRERGESSEGATEEKSEKRERPARGGRNKEPEIKLYVGSSPHLRSPETVPNVMRDVVIALIPTLLAGTYFFGIRALILTLVSVLSAVGCEYLYQKFTKKTITVTDYSAIITGMLLAYNVPVTLPYWMVALGSAFAIIIVKQLYGGIGMNFMNPALAARAALMASFPAAMGNYVAPNAPALERFANSLFGTVDAGTYATIDVATYATPLSNGQQVSLGHAILGLRGGCIGEVSTLCLLLGAGYLLYKGVIKPRIPFIFIATTAVVLVLTGTPVAELPVQIFMGGLILGAFFMATDYVTAPVNRKAQIFFAMGCGIITAAIRAYGALPEGVSYSILFMNVLSPLLEKYCIPKVFGEGRAKK